MHSNVSAGHFWARAIPSFTGQAIHPVLVDKDGKCWKLFSFESKRVTQQKLGNDAKKEAKHRRQKLMPEAGEPE
jgi:hypothetical protein